MYTVFLRPSRTVNYISRLSDPSVRPKNLRLLIPEEQKKKKTGHWKVTGRIDFKILISNFWSPGEGFKGFRPQIRLQHAKISMLTSFEVNWLQFKRFPKFCPVAFQWPVLRF